MTLPTAVLDVDVSRNPDIVFAACMDGGIHRVSIPESSVERIGGHDSYASGVASIDGGARVISAGYDGTVRWHDVTSRSAIRCVRAHRFWSWQLAVSRPAGLVASAGGQYLCGGYRYEPRVASEPPVKVHDLSTGSEVHALEHVPPVQSVAFSPDGRILAAGNLMGEVRVWEAGSGNELARWTTPSFTGWGIIKGHYYTGGVFSMCFTPSQEEILLAGMGSTRDPAAGNGRQLWERFAWREDPPRKVDETHRGESGTGLMETIALHPSSRYFVMGGRIARGSWNVAFFDTRTGARLHSLNTQTRITRAVFSPDGRRLCLAAAVKQTGPDAGGRYEPFGRIHVYRVPRPARAF